jgi:hypothetical protein
MRSLALLLCLFAVADAYVRLPFAAVPASSALRSAVTASDGQFAPTVSWDWQKVAENVFEKDDRPIILFDGHCNLCNGGVNFALDHDPKGKSLRTRDEQSENVHSLLDTVTHLFLAQLISDLSHYRAKSVNPS